MKDKKNLVDNAYVYLQMLHIEVKPQYRLVLKYVLLKDIYPHPVKTCDHIQWILTTKLNVIRLHLKIFMQS